jgi:hypothetical protein
MTQAVRYSETLTVQVQPGFRSLIDKAALSAGAKSTEWTRQALTEALRASGFEMATYPACDQKTNPATPLSQEEAV